MMANCNDLDNLRDWRKQDERCVLYHGNPLALPNRYDLVDVKHTCSSHSKLSERSCKDVPRVNGFNLDLPNRNDLVDLKNTCSNHSRPSEVSSRDVPRVNGFNLDLPNHNDLMDVKNACSNHSRPSEVSSRDVPRVNGFNLDLPNRNNLMDLRNTCSNHSRPSEISSRDVPRVNGYIHHQLRPRSSKSGPEIRIINPAIYTKSLNYEDEEESIEVRVRVKNVIEESHDRRRPVVEENYDQRRPVLEEIYDHRRPVVEETHDRRRPVVEESRDRKRPVVEANCGDTNVENEAFSKLAIENEQASLPGIDHAGDQNNNPGTYRCYSSTSTSTATPVGASTASSNSNVSATLIVRDERRYAAGEVTEDTQNTITNSQTQVQRYTFNGQRVVKISTASHSSTSVSDYQTLNGVVITKKIGHEEWLREKRASMQRKKEELEREEAKKREEAERLEREKEERERRDRESFLKWTEKKRKEEAEKKAAMERELELQKRLKDIEDEAAVAKMLYLRQWIRKKDEKQKEQQRKEQLKQKEIEEEKKKRLEESSKAYEKWRESSKNRPKPATQGLLPHQKAKPAYVNPTPWKGIIDEESEDVSKDESSNKKTRANHSKANGRKGISTHR